MRADGVALEVCGAVLSGLLAGWVMETQTGCVWVSIRAIMAVEDV